MNRLRFMLPAAVGAATLLLAGCGSASSGSSTSPSPTQTPTAGTTSAASGDLTAAKAALKQTLLAGVHNGTFPVALDSTGATCVADAVVDQFGLQKIQQLGLAKQPTGAFSLSPADSTYFVTKVVDCAPQNSAVTGLQAQLNKGLTTATQQQKTCLDAAITREAVIAYLASQYDGQAAQGQAAFGAAIRAAAPGCGLGH